MTGFLGALDAEGPQAEAPAGDAGDGRSDGPPGQVGRAAGEGRRAERVV